MEMGDRPQQEKEGSIRKDKKKEKKCISAGLRELLVVLEPDETF